MLPNVTQSYKDQTWKVVGLKLCSNYLLLSIVQLQWFPNLFEALPRSWSRLCLITLNKIFSHFRSKIHFVVIAHNTEQKCGFSFALSPEESHITPGG